MTARRDSDGSIRYRDRGGLLVFGIWSLFVFALVVGAGWSAVVTREAPWFAVVGFAGLLVFSFYSMSLQVTLAPSGELIFQGLLRRQSWSVTDLRNVRPEAGCIVFKFAKGGAMVASGSGDEWLDLCRRIKTLNPEASLNIPGMFRPPPDPDADASEP